MEDGLTAAFFAACEARARARPRGTPSRGDPASTGGPLGGEEVPDDACEPANKEVRATELSGVHERAAAGEHAGCTDVNEYSDSLGEEEAIAGKERKGRANSGGPLHSAEVDTGVEEDEGDIMRVAAATGSPTAVVGDPDVAVNAAKAEADSDGNVAVEGAKVDSLGGSPGRGMAWTEFERRHLC